MEDIVRWVFIREVSIECFVPWDRVKINLDFRVLELRLTRAARLFCFSISNKFLPHHSVTLGTVLTCTYITITTDK